MSRELKLHQKALIAAVVVATAMLLLAVGVYAYDQAQKNQIAPGVSIGGVDVGARSAGEAREVVEREVVAPLKKPVIVSYGGESYKLSPGQLDQFADVDGMIDEAIEHSREGGLAERVTRYVQGSSVEANLDPQVSYSEKAVDKFVAELAEQINREPQDASIEPSSDRLVPTPGETGRTLREDAVRELVTSEVEEPGAGEPIEPTVEVVKPEITTKELAKEYPTYLTISQSEYKLRLFVNLKLAKSYPIAVGGGGYSTPLGLHSIQDKQVNPTWNVPTTGWAGSLGGQSIPPGPSNPLKERWLGIYDGAGIHGTDDTGSIGSAASHGCVRMLIPDVIDLYDRVEVGTPIYIE